MRFHYSDGHTPGLMLAEIVGAHGQGGVVFCADLIPGRPWVHLPVTMGYDRFPEMLIDEKSEFLADKLARGVRLFFTHDTGCAMAGVQRDGKGRYSTVDEMPELSRTRRWRPESRSAKLRHPRGKPMITLLYAGLCTILVDIPGRARGAVAVPAQDRHWATAATASC